jgi:hypothetical protein
MPYYLTVPTSISLPANGAKVDLAASAELHRDDSAVPNALTVDNASYKVFVLSDPADATASAPTGPSVTFISEGTDSTVISSAGNWTFSALDLSGIPEGGEVLLTVWWRGASGPSADIGTPTLDGTSVPLVNVSAVDAKTTNQRSRVAMYRVARPAGDSSFNLAIPWSSGTISGVHYTIHYVQNRTSNVALDVSTAFDDAPGTINADANGAVFFAVAFENATADGVFSGVTTSGTWRNAASVRAAMGLATGTADENRSISCPNPANTDANCFLTLSIA